jgi:DME family drug/metabolite transporter
MTQATDAVASYGLVWLAAGGWATLGIIYRSLDAFGVPPLTIALGRAGLGVLLLLAGLGLARPQHLRLTRRSVSAVALYGAVGVGGFYVAYVQAVLNAGMALAAVLLYTAPAWVALIAWRCLGETLTRRHAGAVLLSLLGAALVARVFSADPRCLNWAGIGWGLLAGCAHGLWSVLNKIGMQRANLWTLQTYGLLIGALVLLPFQSFTAVAAALREPAAVAWLLILAVVPPIGVSAAYAAGVQRRPDSVASVVATLEPVLAVGLAWAIYGETLSPAQWLGGGLILAAVWLLRPRHPGPTNA